MCKIYFFLSPGTWIYIYIYFFNLTCFRESLCDDENLKSKQERSLVEAANCYLLELLIHIAFSYIMQNIAGTVIHL